MKNIVITILTILLLLTGGYLIYDKVLLQEENVNEKQNEITDDEQIQTNIESNDYEGLIKELNQVFEFVYEYFDAGNAYCGEHGDEFITTDKTPSNGFFVSKQFKSYQEMINFLKQYMTEEVIYSRQSMKEEYYVEKDGKLYCEDFGKGGNLYQPDKFIIQTNNVSADKINATVAAELSYDEYTKDYINYEVVFTKLNDNWVISSYQKQS